MKNNVSARRSVFVTGLFCICLLSQSPPAHAFFDGPFPEHGRQAKANLAQCGACHQLHPNTDVDPNSWGWDKDLGSIGTCDPGSTTICRTCHSQSLEAPIGPRCTDCHQQSPFTSPDCSSCHGMPPNGEVWPNRAGSHMAHRLPDVNDLCSICHAGAGGGSGNHYDTIDDADVAIRAAYSSKAGAASYDPNSGTCSNVRCHGGQETPAWGSDDAIIENLDCESCHLRPNSLEPPTDAEANTSVHTWPAHFKHLASSQARMANIRCSYCHDANLLAINHYKGIETPELNTETPRESIWESFGYIDTETRSCGGACHTAANKRWGTVSKPKNTVNSTDFYEIPAAVEAAWFQPGIVAGTGWKTEPVDVDVPDANTTPDWDKAVKYLQVLGGKQTLFLEESQQMVAVAHYCDGTSALVTQDVDWTWGGADLLDQATIDANGLFTAGETPGLLKVTATLSQTGHSMSMPIKVVRDYENSLNSIQITSADRFPVLLVGNSVQLTARGISVDGDQEDYSHKVDWESSHPEAASVDDTGMVTGLSFAEGVIIRATDRETGLVGSYSLRVTKLRLDPTPADPANPDANDVDRKGNPLWDPISISIRVWDATQASSDRLETFQPVNEDGTVHIGKNWFVLFVATAHYADGSSRELVDVVKSADGSITPTYEVYFDTTEAWAVPVAQTTGYPELAHWWGWTKGRDYDICTITATDPKTGITGSVLVNVNNWGSQFE